MNNFILYLTPYGKEVQILKLKSINAVILKSENKIFSNLTYSGKIDFDEPDNVSKLQLFINDSFVETIYNSNDGSFQMAGRPFNECYGYVQIMIKFSYNGDTFHLTTDYISVMVRSGLQNESVQRMASYVYKNNDLLFDSEPINFNKAYNNQKSLDVRLLLLKEFVRAFKVNYPQFKNNSQFTTVQAERIDRFEKLRNFTANTIKFIAQHPDELQLNGFGAGIQINLCNYQPVRTLITNNVTSYDIMENRAIIDFLYTLLDEIRYIKNEITQLVSNLQEKPVIIDNYVESNFFVYSNAADHLNSKLPELNKLESQYSKLLANYSAIYNIKGVKMITLPKPTIIFLSMPQYRQIYDCMTKWFKLGAFNPDEEKHIFQFLKISTLYEEYVLLKLINYLRDSNFDVTKHDNEYSFVHGDYKFTIYYQPMIYNRQNSTGLYRNNSIKFPDGEDIAGGSYYTPDFLIKAEHSSEAVKFIIVDAKYSTVENVKMHQVARLSFKYLFSLSPINPADEIIALYIINGQSENDEDDCTPIYDKSLSNIKPAAEIITLTENSTNSRTIHNELISRIFNLD